MEIIVLTFLCLSFGSTLFFFVSLQVYWCRVNLRPYSRDELDNLQRVVHNNLGGCQSQVVADLSKLVRRYSFSLYNLFKTRSAYQYILVMAHKRISRARSDDEVESSKYICSIIYQLMDGVYCHEVNITLRYYKPLNF